MKKMQLEERSKRSTVIQEMGFFSWLKLSNVKKETYFPNTFN